MIIAMGLVSLELIGAVQPPVLLPALVPDHHAQLEQLGPKVRGVLGLVVLQSARPDGQQAPAPGGSGRGPLHTGTSASGSPSVRQG